MAEDDLAPGFEWAVMADGGFLLGERGN
ncbi:hypothetical protein CCACVL1_27478 [Corchorus capsularis]|uniref:Uncharacterized protein n=1 Tax=Corchorus capsularis TaxID=210143 RepID=A0A1R3GA09_COCAP|nr:hypothetical protein CCACVL1_27478 [Corchorus capsularis]